jgi:hypothetical protein
MTNDDKRMADKLERAKLLQSVEEAETKHYEAARDARAKRAVASAAETAESNAKRALDNALAALAEKLKMGSA